MGGGNGLCVWGLGEGSWPTGEEREAEGVGEVLGDQVLRGQEVVVGIGAFPSVTRQASGQAGQRELSRPRPLRATPMSAAAPLGRPMNESRGRVLGPGGQAQQQSSGPCPRCRSRAPPSKLTKNFKTPPREHEA